MPTGIDLRVAPLHPDLHDGLLADWPVGAWDTRAPLLVVPNRGLGRALVRDAARMHGAAFGADVGRLVVASAARPPVGARVR